MASSATGQELWLSTRCAVSASACSTKPCEQQSRDHVTSLYEVWADTSRSLAPDSIHDPRFCHLPVPGGELGDLAAALPLSPGSLGCAACWSMARACGSSGTWEEATTSCLDVMCLTPRCLLGSFRHTAHFSLPERRSKNRILL